MNNQFTHRLMGRLRSLVLISFFMLSALNGFADHFRYGNISWQRVQGNPYQIKFKIQMAFKRSFFANAASLNVGALRQIGQFNFGDGSPTQAVILAITAVNLQDDWFYGEWTTTKTYVSTPAVYLAHYTSPLQRLGPPLVNNTAGNIVINTNVQVGPGFGNDAPVSTIPPILNVPVTDTDFTYQIPALDPNGDALTYSLTPNDSFGVGCVQPAGLSITPSGLLSWSGAGKTVGALYNGSIRVKDSRGVHISLDVLLRVVGHSTPSDFDYSVSPPNGTIFNIQPGDSLTFQTKVGDSDTGDTVKLTAYGVPPGGTFTTSGTNPVTGDFGWKPTPSQQGDFVINITSEDKAGVQNNTVINLNVSYKPRFNVPTTPGNNSVFTLQPGQNIAHPVQAFHPDTPDRVILTAPSGLKSGMSFTPNFPIALANPVTTNFSWTPVASDWGINRLVFKAEDTFYHETAFDTIYYFVDHPPVINSTPTVIAYAGSPYTYELTAYDIDTPYGDFTKLEIAQLPAFLTATANGKDKWNVTGTPSAAQVGTYTVNFEVADSLNHIMGTHAGNAVQSYTLQVVPALTVSGNTTNATIFGLNNGAVDVTVAGGVGPYTYGWNNSSTSEDLSGIVAGTYTVTVTDANGKTVTGSFTVTQPAQLTATAQVNGATIYGVNNGSIDVTPAGGVGPYTYVWSNNATTQDLTGVGAGTYTVTVTDANGATYTNTYTITQPAQLTVSGQVANVTIYGQSNGGVNITPAGGVGPYTYSWSNSATTEDINGVAAGTYTVTVTDANGATATDNWTVTQPAQLIATAQINGATIYGVNNGSIDITPTGGVGPYTYLWSNNATSQDLTGIGAGAYTVTVTDANGATYTNTYTITQPAQLAVSGQVTNVTTYGGNNGAINVTVTGGVGPYTYSWNGGITTEDRTNLIAGTYTVTVTDSKGATKTGSFTVSQPSNLNGTISVNPQYTVNANHAPYTLYLGYRNSVNLTALPTGGTPGYTYSWSPASSVSNPTAATVKVSPTSTTTYTVTITDSKGATKTVSQTITVKDIRCYAGNSPLHKVYVCHNDKNTICIDTNALLTHLNNHGDLLGQCGNNKSSEYGDDHGDDHNIMDGLHSAQMTVYPNPSNGAFTVRIPAIHEKGQVMVRDMMGRLVSTTSIEAADEDQIFQVDLSNVARGTYVVIVISGGDVYKSNILIQ